MDMVMVMVMDMDLGLDRYADLKAACEAVMAWADPGFAYDHLAITKGFTASPHIDKEDQSFQYAMALGDFHGGGELLRRVGTRGPPPPSYPL